MLEAMACGTPVIAGNTSAMPEIAGEKGILADPFNEEDIANKLLLLENDHQYYARASRLRITTSNKFSWESTALSLLKNLPEYIGIKL